MAKSDTTKRALPGAAEPLAARTPAVAPASGTGTDAPTSATSASATQRSVTDLFEVRAAIFEVPPSDADRVTSAAQELAAYAEAHEPRTRFFAVLRDQDCRDQDCSVRFLCAAVFDDEEAERAHLGSAAAHQFADVLLTARVRLESARWTSVAGV